MRVLIVDDEKSIRELLKEILEEEGFEVFTEESGSKVVERIEELFPEVLILDLFLPGISGMEVLEKLNKLGLTEKIAVIIVSGHGSVETSVKAMKLGAFDFIEKPIKYEKLLNAIEAATRRVQRKNNSVEQFLTLPLKKAKEEFEKTYIVEILKKFNGDMKKAAAFMEIDISNLYRKINKYRLSDELAQKGN